MKMGQHRFEDVFTGCRPMAFGSMPIRKLEHSFNSDSFDTRGNFHALVLEVGAIRLRYRKPEEFFGRASEEKYHAELQRQDALEAAKPNGGVKAQEAWQVEHEKCRAKLAEYEKVVAELDRYILAELDLGKGEKIPRTFDEYAGRKRLCGPEGTPLTKKKVLELAKLEGPLLDWPCLFRSLGERVDLFAATEELTLVPRLVRFEAADLQKNPEELLEDEAYLEGLAEKLLEYEAEELRDLLNGWLVDRARSGGVPKPKKQVVAPMIKTGKRFEVYLGACGYLFVGERVLLDGEELLALRRDDLARAEYARILRDYVHQGFPTERMNGAPPSTKAVAVVDEERVPGLFEEIAGLKARNRFGNQRR